MPVNKDQLGNGEQVILTVRTHAKALVGPALLLIVLGSALGIAIALAPPAWQPIATYVAIGVFALLVVWLVLVPFLRWRTSTYTVTDRRIITRKGILNKVGHDLPLRRINNVNYEKSLTDRMLGCGTLVLETAAGQPLMLPDVPGVEKVHRTIADLLFAGDDGYDD
ncbi:PH domain-containing protein [Tessaracoccus flavus]|uniref:Uncharacterized protein n=1 Tax=Tessaracoccus flavus TaxID=1610493 RepID=A0A1Q2CFX6_9ACTN|nr:PH domain-containing protein [Tessaracoccus flavus]AQP45018.1 hypothetical protein RPIT_09645 [Tessaracoccus flavus]SDY59117.1 PH domain-containing protein [Tessaracoccus flavus]